MIEPQEAISIPIAYIETFVMMLGAFIIGYSGATIYSRYTQRKQNEKHRENTKHLLNKNKILQEQLDSKTDGVYSKDRMDQEFEQLSIHKRAFSEEVILEKVQDKEDTTEIDFTRLGIASRTERNELQQITGIGPYTEVKLNELGIYTFEQISRFTKEDIHLITKLIKFFPDRIKNDRWVDKAKRLHKLLEDSPTSTNRLSNEILKEKATY